MRQPTPVRILMVALACLAAGCGTDYVPPSFETTGVPAQPLGPVYDLEVSLPHLFVPEVQAAGLNLEMRLELEAAGLGIQAARTVIVEATAGMGRAVDVEDLAGRTTVTMTPSTWATGRIGPLKVGSLLFEMMLDGEPEAGGRLVVGDSWESQTALNGPFRGWSRHRFLVATTDYSATGRVTEVALVKETEIEVRRDLAPVSSDPFLRSSGGAVFALNRFTFDNIQRLDPQRDFATAWQADMGIGANPHDLVLLPDGRAMVSRHEPPFNDVAIIDGESGEILDTIPLGSLAENPDGTPRADGLIQAEGAVFAGLQDIDRTFTRYGQGKLAVLDPLLDALVGVIPLGGKNPGPMELLLGADGRTRIYLALAGIYPGLLPQELSGGVVVVDLVNRAVERWALDDDDAGGNVSGLAMASESLGYVVVSDAAYTNRVLAFDPATGDVRRELLATANYIPEIEIDTGAVLAIPDSDFTSPRLCLYRLPADPAGTETLLGCGMLELTPTSVEALD
jgi:hypothetical protein